MKKDQEKVADPAADALPGNMPIAGFREIAAAYLHQSANWPGVFNEKTLTAQRIAGIKMYMTPQGILIELKKKQCIVPYANVANYVLV